MPNYLYPGVYVQEIQTGSMPIQGVSTSTAGFLGIAERGPATPTLCTSFADYQRSFGGYVSEMVSGVALDRYLAYGVEGFFLNGGQTCYVQRVFHKDTESPQNSAQTAQASIPDVAFTTSAAMKIFAIGPGSWGNRIACIISQAGLNDSSLFKLTVMYWATGPTQANYPSPDVTEVFDNLSAVAAASTFYGNQINGSSNLITVQQSAPLLRPANTPTVTPTITPPTSGTAAVGQINSFTVVVSSSTSWPTPTGTVILKNGNVAVGASSLSTTGTATFANSFSAAGSQTFTAQYTGDSLYNSITSASWTLTVTGAAVPNVTITAPSTPFSSGSTLTATVTGAASTTAPSGTVTFQDITPSSSPTTLGAPVNLVSTTTGGIQGPPTAGSPPLTTIGLRTIVALYSGDPNYSAYSSAPLQVPVGIGSNAATVTIATVTAGQTTVAAGSAISFTATVAGPAAAAAAPSGTVTFQAVPATSNTSIPITLGTTGALSAAAGAKSAITPALQVTISTAGAYTITALYLGDANYQNASNQFTLTVTAATGAVTAPLLAASAGAPILMLANGSDGTVATGATSAIVPGDFMGDASDPLNKTGLEALADVDDISILCCPDEFYFHDGDKTIAGYLQIQCESLMYRFAILQSPQNAPHPPGHTPSVNSEWAAYYYPWLYIVSPTTGALMLVPPAGYIAGIYARSDNNRGVQKDPANEPILGIDHLQLPINNSLQGQLNPLGINCLRYFSASGNLVWGGRTTSSDPDWKYISTRRLFIFIEQSIQNSTQWVVFEPNDSSLWSRVIRSVSDFLTDCWKQGMLQGQTKEQAFFVRCDMTTMTQTDIDNGKLIMLIGIAPVMPAEFVIFQIGQWDGGSSVTES